MRALSATFQSDRQCPNCGGFERYVTGTQKCAPCYRKARNTYNRAAFPGAINGCGAAKDGGHKRKDPMHDCQESLKILLRKRWVELNMIIAS